MRKLRDVCLILAFSPVFLAGWLVSLIVLMFVTGRLAGHRVFTNIGKGWTGGV